jgi:hypothetical protein
MSKNTSGNPQSPSFRTGFTNDYVPGALNVISPLTTGGYAGCMVLVPTSVPPGSNYNSYYFVLVYIRHSAGPTAVQLPNVQGILLVDLPQGIGTPLEVIEAALNAGVSPAPPGGVGGT